MTQSNEVQGIVAASATRNALLISATRTAISSGANAALSAAIHAGLAFAVMVNLAPEGQAIKREDARVLLGAGLKVSKDVNDDFVERTLSSGVKLAQWLSKNKAVYTDTMTKNSLESGVAFLADYLSENHGIRDRKAINKFLSNAPQSKGIADSAATRIAKGIAKGPEGFDAAEFGRLLVKALSSESLAAFNSAFSATYAAELKLRADAAALAAATAEQNKTGTEG